MLKTSWITQTHGHGTRQDWVHEQTMDREGFKAKLYQLDVWMNERSFLEAKTYVDGLVDV